MAASELVSGPVSFPEPSLPARSAWNHAFLFAAGIGVLGLASALWLYTSYNGTALLEGRAPRVSFGDALGTGLMDWALWAPFCPLVMWLARRFPLERARPWRALLVHSAVGPLLSLAQLALFALASVALRALLYEQDPAWTSSEIVQDALRSAFQFKFKSGLLLYLAVFAGVSAYQARRRLREREPRRAAPDRWMASAGGRVALLSFEEIAWVEAAGNYLRIHAGGQVHLDRATLRGFLERARGHGFVQVHRSALVRAGCIAGMSAAGSGDLELTLLDGTRLRASRRYRAGLDRLHHAVRPAGTAARPGPGAAASDGL